MAALRLLVGLGNPGTEYCEPGTMPGSGFLTPWVCASRRFGNDGKVHGETAKIVLTASRSGC